MKRRCGDEDLGVFGQEKDVCWCRFEGEGAICSHGSISVNLFLLMFSERVASRCVWSAPAVLNPCETQANVHAGVWGNTVWQMIAMHKTLPCFHIHTKTKSSDVSVNSG